MRSFPTISTLALWTTVPGFGSGFSPMAKDPTKDPEFKRVLGNLLKAKPKPHAKIKVGRKRRKVKPGK
jgi:hypothetical protein